MLNPQEYEAPIQGWVEGVYHPARNPGRIILLSLPEAAGVFRWTLLGETKIATATSQGYRTEEDEGTSAFEVSMVRLGWQNDELIWVKNLIEDQPAVRVMNLVKQEDDSESGKDKKSPRKDDLEKKQTMVYCVTGLPISKQQELVEASFQLEQDFWR